MADIVDTTYVEVPSHELVAGEKFTIEIKSRFSNYLHNAGLKFTVGSGLRLGSIVLSSGFNTAVSDASDASDEVSAVFAGRKDLTDPRPPAEQSLPTDEVLLTATVTVLNSVTDGGSASLQVTLLKDLTDKTGGLLPSDQYGFGVIDSRIGMVANSPAFVHFRENAVVGIFASAAIAELVNTAAVSGNALITDIDVYGVKLRAQHAPLVADVTCSSRDPAVLQVDGNCRAVLSGNEVAGARELHVDLTYGSFDASVPFRVFAVVPDSLSLLPSQTEMRAVAGWYDADEQDCTMLNYQTLSLVATANFSDGEEEIVELDVSLLVRLDSNRTDLIVFDSTAGGAPLVAATGSARSTISGFDTVRIEAAQGTNGARFSNPLRLTIYDQLAENRIAVIGLDWVVFSGLGDVHVDPDLGTSYPRNSAVQFHVDGFKTVPLSFEGDAMWLAVYAVLEDKSRIELTPDKGLVLETLAPSSVAVSIAADGNKVIVPYDPVADDGDLVSATWSPGSSCEATHGGFIAAYATTNVTLSITPPQATEMQATTALSSQKNFLVPVGDAAADSAAGFSTSTQITVKMTFPTQVSTVDPSDTRASYVASVGAPFSVDDTGLITANSIGETGSGTVFVSFRGQSVNATVSVTVAKYHRLETVARPYPSYSGSGNVIASTLAPIECTVPTHYQQAKLKSTMVLTNDAEATIRSNRVELTIVDLGSGLTASSSLIVTVANPGNATIRANFVTDDTSIIDANAAAVEITVTANEVSVAAITNFKLGSNLQTFSGIKGQTQEWLALAVTLSDGRQYPSMLKNGNSWLDGVMTYTSSETSAASVDATTGQVTLINNHYEDVTLEAKVCPENRAVSGNAIVIQCNLLPSNVGDVDLGDESGVPVAAQLSALSSFAVPLRVDTGSTGSLQLFSIQIHLDSPFVDCDQHSCYVELKEVTASDNLNQLQVGYATSGSTITIAGEVSKNAGSGVIELVTMSFEVVKLGSGGLVSFSGTVNQLVDYAVDSNNDGLVIGQANAPFIAGAVDFALGSVNGRRRRNVVVSTDSRLRRTGDELINQLPLRVGDANCDGEYDLKDAKKIVDYVVGSYAGFTTTLGRNTMLSVQACQSKRALDGLPTDVLTFMDPDGDSKIGPTDLSYLLTIEVGKFYFFEVHVEESNCSQLEVEVFLSTKEGAAPPSGTRVLLEITYGEDVSSALRTALATNAGTVATSTTGTLIEATIDSDRPYRYTVSLDTGSKQFEGVGVSLFQYVTQTLANEYKWQFFGTHVDLALIAEDSPEYMEMTERWLAYSSTTLGSDMALTLLDPYEPLIGNVSCSFVPTAVPTVAPTLAPTPDPTRAPTNVPSLNPTASPTAMPSDIPSAMPSLNPTANPTAMPSDIPVPSRRSTRQQTQPPCHPTYQVPCRRSTRQQTQPPCHRTYQCHAVAQPDSEPKRHAIGHPSAIPSLNPTANPSAMPSDMPSAIPSLNPTANPTAMPSDIPVPCRRSTRRQTQPPYHLPYRRSTRQQTQPPCHRTYQVPSRRSTRQRTQAPCHRTYPVLCRRSTRRQTQAPCHLPSRRSTRQQTQAPCHRTYRVPSRRSIPTANPSAMPSDIQVPSRRSTRQRTQAPCHRTYPVPSRRSTRQQTQPPCHRTCQSPSRSTQRHANSLCQQQTQPPCHRTYRVPCRRSTRRQTQAP